jgi:hypothetical protein
MMWKEAAVAHFQVLSRHLPRGNEEQQEHIGQDSGCPG